MGLPAAARIAFVLPESPLALLPPYFASTAYQPILVLYQISRCAARTKVCCGAAAGGSYARIARVEGRCLAQGRVADVEGAWEVRVFYEKKDPQRTLFCR